MHSFIYQIEKSPVATDERMDESVFYDHLEDIPADYVSNIIDKDKEVEAIGLLPQVLPSTMFRCEGREITFLGGNAELIKMWQEGLKELICSNSPDDLANGHGKFLYLYNVANRVNNILDTASRFFCNENGYAAKSTEFILGACHAKPGDKFYVGAVVAYHF